MGTNGYLCSAGSGLGISFFNYQHDITIRLGWNLPPTAFSFWSFRHFPPIFMAALDHIYNIQHFKVRGPSVESRKNCLPRDTQVFQFMSGTRHWCATGHHNDSSGESKGWSQPQHSLFKHSPWSGVVRDLFIYLQRCCFWRFSGFLNQHVADTNTAEFWMCQGAESPLRIS